jgi:hypothetical protein
MPERIVTAESEAERRRTYPRYLGTSYTVLQTRSGSVYVITASPLGATFEVGLRSVRVNRTESIIDDRCQILPAWKPVAFPILEQPYDFKVGLPIYVKLGNLDPTNNVVVTTDVVEMIVIPSELQVQSN